MLEEPRGVGVGALVAVLVLHRVLVVVLVLGLLLVLVLVLVEALVVVLVVVQLVLVAVSHPNDRVVRLVHLATRNPRGAAREGPANRRLPRQHPQLSR